MFGEDSSPKVKKFMKVLLDSFNSIVGGGGDSAVGGGDGSGGDSEQRGVWKTGNGNGGWKQARSICGIKAKEAAGKWILISGCQTDQTSADATKSAESYGALSHTIQTILEELDGKVISNREIVVKARNMLKSQGFKQRPGLYCEDKHADAPFICSAA
ncbi:hypothetical protein HanOQP8_Chr00c169g0780481 [Helianthus annuus]|nr:hypothetical protein HanOQP8_Chr00c169g0780481 [Helianthus annuus]